MRTLQYDFSFDTDEHAWYLREAFCCLVPTINPIENEHRTKLNKLTKEFEVAEFDIIKRFLDSSKGGSSSEGKTKATKVEQKFRFLGIEPNSNKLHILDNYASDDSDQEISIAEDDCSILQTQTAAGISKFHNKNLHATPDAKIYYTFSENNLSSAAANDLTLINQAFRQAKANPSNPRMQFNSNGHVIFQNRKINTLFLVPGFRGINHMNRFSDEVRRTRRVPEFQKALIGQPAFSESVLMSAFNFYNDAETWKNIWENNELVTVLKTNAEELERQLLALKNKDYILVHNLSAGKNHLFSNWLHAAQHIYSNGIVKLQRTQRHLLKEHNIILPLLNAYNPFVSESETPYHAMRYACGLKSLYEPASRRPCYHSDGKPAFTYIGEIFITLRPVSTVASEYERNVVRQLAGETSIQASYEIKPELEATGFGWAHANEVVHSEVIKCPNLRGAYQQKYAEKFGLTKILFEKFKTAIITASTDEQRTAAEQHILKWLCHYKSIVLMEKAVAIAKQRGCEIAFKAPEVGLTEQLPHVNVVALDVNRKDMLEKLAHKLYETRTKNTVLFEEKLTSAKTIFYAIDERSVINALQQLDYSSDAIQQFILQENALRTPPSAELKPRTILNLAPESSSPYKTYQPSLEEKYSSSPENIKLSRVNLLNKFSSVLSSPMPLKQVDQENEKICENFNKLGIN